MGNLGDGLYGPGIDNIVTGSHNKERGMPRSIPQLLLPAENEDGALQRLLSPDRRPGAGEGLRVEPWAQQTLVSSSLVLRGQEELWGRPGHAALLIVSASDYIIDAGDVETVSQVSQRFSQN